MSSLKNRQNDTNLSDKFNIFTKKQFIFGNASVQRQRGRNQFHHTVIRVMMLLQINSIAIRNIYTIEYELTVKLPYVRTKMVSRFQSKRGNNV